VTLTFPPGVELMTDVSPAAWAEERLMARLFATAGATVPDGFESYARILHPAYRRLEDGREEAVTWTTVASWMGESPIPSCSSSGSRDWGPTPTNILIGAAAPK
jgi:hypothetical protein